jgi:hypothetical protein
MVEYVPVTNFKNFKFSQAKVYAIGDNCKHKKIHIIKRVVFNSFNNCYDNQRIVEFDDNSSYEMKNKFLYKITFHSPTIEQCDEYERECAEYGETPYIIHGPLDNITVGKQKLCLFEVCEKE